ncbi:hypothetical protein LshimejAT787_1100330 [Lyophyllum shimeji]|uniref:Major facilitator superfamily (MFS) profile domain-containing protein n=1 Tax=Lyophyllum shimeji TaxID=47721 RepID=A0A9P3PUX9_LYOSH|nr:hypothetical protein LshimejAT787_1100330 [Lyophyllum shimeji]
MTLSIFLLSFAFGPLILAPLSEMYGRTWLYNICNVLSIAFSLGLRVRANRWRPHRVPLPCGIVRECGNHMWRRCLSAILYSERERLTQWHCSHLVLSSVLR